MADERRRPTALMAIGGQATGVSAHNEINNLEFMVFFSATCVRDRHKNMIFEGPLALVQTNALHAT